MGMKGRPQAPTLEATEHDGRNDRRGEGTPAGPPATTAARRGTLPAILSQKRVWGALGGAAAVILVVAGFARILTAGGARPAPTAIATPSATTAPSPTASPTPAVVPTLVAAQPLSWQPGTAPIRLVREIDPPVLALSPAPADGRVAYLCGAQWTDTNTDIQPQVWVTTDRAATWTQITTLPLQQRYNSCETVANDTAASSAMVTMGYNGASASDFRYDDFATFDGGKTWSEVGAGSSGRVRQLATVGDVVYALRGPLDMSMPAQLFTTSAQQFATVSAWQRVDATLPAHIQRFWVNPATGALLVFAYDDSKQWRLYQSTDGGKNWSLVPVPSDFTDVVVQRPTTATPWHVCISAPNPAGPLGNATCSADGGQSWTTYQWPAGSDSGSDFHVGLADDGSLLVRGSAGTDANGMPRYMLFRLARGGTQWQSLGPIPELALTYSAGPGSGLLWALPAVGIGIDPQQRPFTASYPA